MVTPQFESKNLKKPTNIVLYKVGLTNLINNHQILVILILFNNPYPIFTAYILNLIVIEFKAHLTKATEGYYIPMFCFPKRYPKGKLLTSGK